MHDQARSTTATATAESDSRSVSLEVEIHGRWDALSLSEALASYHSFLVHHEGQRWVVHARTPGCHDESLEEALRTIEDWLADRGLDGAPCTVGRDLDERRA